MLVAVGLGCGTPQSAGPPAPPVPTNIAAPPPARSCNEAAAGLERGTRSVRDPDVSVLGEMRARCVEDAWSAAAIECFAVMKEDDLGRCAGELASAPRDRLFTTLGGGFDDRTAIAIAQARLGNLKVGITECDRFVTGVARALGCEQMDLETRAALGNETADFWSLPTTNLPADASRRMAAVCAKSLTFLQQQVADAGCMP